MDDGGVGVEVSNNLFYGIGNTVVMHDGRDTNVHDNVLVNADGLTGVTVTDEMVGLMEAITAGEADLVADSDFYRAWVAYFEMVEANPDYKAVLLEQRPDLFLLSADPDDILKPEFVLSPTNTVTGNVVICSEPDAQILALNDNIRPYVTLENNRSFGIDENPFFVNPTLGDYRLADGVTGCPDVQFEKIGRY